MARPDVIIAELLRVEPGHAHHLGDHLVAVALNIEIVDVAAAEHGPHVSRHLLHVYPEIRRLVPIDLDVHLRLVELQIGVGKVEEPAFDGALHQFVGDLRDPQRILRGQDDELHRRTGTAARQRRRREHKVLQAGHRVQFGRHFREHLHGGAGAFIPGFEGHPGERAVVRGEAHGLEHLRGFRELLDDLDILLGKQGRLIDAGIRRPGGHHDHEPLVLVRRQFLLGHRPERHDQQHGDNRDDQHHRPGVHQAVQQPLVAVAELVEGLVQEVREALFVGVVGEQLGAHHGRKRQGNDARDDDGSDQGEGEFPEQRPREPALETDRRIDRRQRDRHRDHRAGQFLRPFETGGQRRQPFLHVPVNVLHHHDRVVDHQADRQHHRQQRQQVDGEAHHEHEEAGAHQRERHRHQRNDDGAHGTEEQEDHHDHDGQRLHQGGDDLIDRVADVGRGIVHDQRIQAGRKLGDNVRDNSPHILDHRERVGRGQDVDGDHGGMLVAEVDRAVIAFRPKDHIGHILQPDDGPVFLHQHELLELVGRVEIRGRVEVDGNHRALGRTHGGEGIVGGQRLPHLHGAEPVGREPVGLEPDPHRKRAAAEDLGALHAVHRREARLHHAGEVVRDLVGFELVAVEADVHRSRRLPHLHVDDRIEGIGRQLVSHLVDLGRDLSQRGVRVVIEPQVRRDHADAGRAAGFEVVDAVGARDLLFQRRRDEALDEVRAGAGVDGRDSDDRAVADRILPDVQKVDRPPSNQQDEQVHDRRQDGALDEEIRELHGGVSCSATSARDCSRG